MMGNSTPLFWLLDESPSFAPEDEELLEDTELFDESGSLDELLDESGSLDELLDESGSLDEPSTLDDVESLDEIAP